MSIKLYCLNCRSSFDTNKKKCPKCDRSVPRTRKTYKVQVMVNGNRRSRYCPTRELAEKLETQMKAAMIQGKEPGKRKIELTVKAAWDMYLTSYQQSGKAWDREVQRFNSIIKPAFGSKLMNSISSFDIEKFKLNMLKTDSRFKRPYSAKSVKHIIDLLSRVYKYAILHGHYIGENPCEKVRRPKVSKTKPRTLSREHVKNLLAVLNSYPNRNTANMVRFLLLTGVRRGECFKLSFNDVNFETNRIILRDPKGGDDQSIPLNTEALSIVKEQRSMLPESELVFPSRTGTQRRHFRKTWSKIKHMANIPTETRVHDLRHTFASIAASKGINIQELQKLMTHRDLTTTMRYAHLFPETLKIASDSVGEAFIDIQDNTVDKPDKDQDTLSK